MPSSSTTFPIYAGVPISATSSVTLVETGMTGDRTAKTRLVHPDAVTFPPLVYYRNPDRRWNFDQAPLLAPIVNVQRTIGSTRVTRFEQGVEDVLVTEVWESGQGRASMTASQFRLLYELLINPPAFDPNAPEYIQWEPRNETDSVFNVELLALQLGGSGENPYDVRVWRATGGQYHGGTVREPIDSLDLVESGLVDREVRLSMRIVSEVA